MKTFARPYVLEKHIFPGMRKPEYEERGTPHNHEGLWASIGVRVTTYK